MTAPARRPTPAPRVPRLVPRPVSVLVAGLVLGLVTALAGCTGDEPSWEAYETSAATPPALAEGCPARDTPLPYPGGGELPTDPVAVRLCNGLGPEGTSSQLFDPPADLLETGVDDLVEIVDDLEPVDLGSQPCTFDLGPTSVLWFLYDDGSARAVSHEHFGCRNTFVAPGQAGAGGEDLVATFDAHLHEQRADRTPPDDHDLRVPSCDILDGPPVSPLALDGGATELATAVYCTEEGRAALTPRQVARLDADLRDRPRPRCARQQARREGTTSIAGRTVWGDAFVLVGSCFAYAVPIGLTYERTPEAEDRQPWWVLSPGVRRMLKALPLR